MTSGRATRWLAAAGWVVIVIAGMRAAEPILVPLLLSVFIALLCAPPVLWLERKGCHTALAVGMVILVVFLIGLGFGAVAGTSLSQFSVAIPRYQQQLEHQLTLALQLLHKMGVKASPEELLRYVDPAAAMRLGATLLSGIGQILTNSFLILITVMFMLFEASTVPRKFHAIRGVGESSVSPLQKFAEDVHQFLAIKTLVSLATGVLVTLWVALLGVDFALLWGLLAFLLNYVPSLGSIIAAAPPVLLATIQYGPGRALLVAVGYVAVNIGFGTILEPRLMGRRLGLSTLAVFLSLVFWGWVLGPVGMVLSVPLTMIFKIAMESSEETRWIGILLGPSSTVPAAAEAMGPQHRREDVGSAAVPPPAPGSPSP